MDVNYNFTSVQRNTTHAGNFKFGLTFALNGFSLDTHEELLSCPVLWVVLIDGKDVEAQLSPASDCITNFFTYPTIPLCIYCSL